MGFALSGGPGLLQVFARGLFIASGIGASQGCVPDSILDAQSESLDTDDEDEGEGDSSTSDYPDAPEGSCTAWKFAYCDAVTACSAFVSREQCELDLGWLVCKEDAPLSECQQKIESALEDKDCKGLPEDCGPATIADRTLVIELCEDIHKEMCEFRFFCGLEVAAEACMDTLALTEPCQEFTSFLPTAVDCAEAYTRLACTEPMPEVCAGSLRF